MIRPLEFCENIDHLVSSIETIDSRILELLNLRKQYIAEKQRVNGMDEIEFVNLITAEAESIQKEQQHEQ